ncbi:MAG TPA: AraC family transcriptional regulator [Verrucomicrobiae bacterium]
MKNYFVYLPRQTENSILGCVTTSTGFANILPHETYPQQQHPVDHHFNWSKGRILQSYQVILISAGTGMFESDGMSGIQLVEPGTIMVLFPGVWHRYRPKPETGWVEHWIECQGYVFDEAFKTGLIQPKYGLLKTGSTRDFTDCFERCHSLAQIDAMANQDLLSTLGLHLLAMLGHLRHGRCGFTKAIDDVVQRALMLIALRCHEPLDFKALAAELGVGYSNFRHSFVARVGISPRQHYLNTRIQKARDLLLKTSKSVKEIAEILGFESASHLSKQFKGRLGNSPGECRDSMARHHRGSGSSSGSKS